MRTVILRVKLKKEQKVADHRTPPFVFKYLDLLTSSIFKHIWLSSFPAHRQRLVSVQSILSQPRQAQVHYNGNKSSLEQELHQRQLFEYFLVVSLQKSKAGAHYLPEVTQQFPPKVRTRGVLESLLLVCCHFALKGQPMDFTPYVQWTLRVECFSACENSCITSSVAPGGVF